MGFRVCALEVAGKSLRTVEELLWKVGWPPEVQTDGLSDIHQIQRKLVWLFLMFKEQSIF